MPGSRRSAHNATARRVGLAPRDYDTKVNAGEKWCSTHREWHPTSAFGADASRYDGLAASCREARRR